MKGDCMKKLIAIIIAVSTIYGSYSVQAVYERDNEQVIKEVQKPIETDSVKMDTVYVVVSVDSTKS